MRVKFHTLGCKLNFSESSTIERMFAEGGFERAEGSEADVHIINSCSVTETADKKCRYLIRRISRENPEAIIAVTGCYAQLKPNDIAALEGVDLVIGNNEKGAILERVREIAEKKGNSAVYICETAGLTSFFNAFSTVERTRAFLKVQDGCSYHCSYCTIPLARGESRNAPIAEIVEEAREIAATGRKEIVLTGINIGDFGHSTGEHFIDLLRELEKVEGVERYRISSIEPNLLSREIIEFTLASRKFMPHFHVPLQSGNDKLLGLMHRRYTSGFFREKIEEIRAIDPDVFFGIDVIVGFPGESEEDFGGTYEFLEKLSPAFLHIFPYSERPNTYATTLCGNVPQGERNERVKILSKLSEELYKKYYNRFIGTEREILVEGPIRGGKMYGYTDNYLRIEVPYVTDSINRLIMVRIKENGEGTPL